MARVSKPRAGSLQYIPKKRAKKEVPRINSWQDPGINNILDFPGYKAGMTHVMALDQRKNSPSQGTEVSVPVTILETPPLKVAGIRFYRKEYEGLETFNEIWAQDIDSELHKKCSLPKKRNPGQELSEVDSEEVADIRLLTHTQPKLTNVPKKKPDLMESAIGGSIEEKLELAKEKLGQEITIEEVFQEKKMVDVTAVTKGKGYQGIVKRYGVKIQPRKASKGRRHVGTGGAWSPSMKVWKEPLPGQMGYHKRTAYNKIVMEIGDNPERINPDGDFLNYGPVKQSYVILKGSVPGPAKRLVRMTHPRKPRGDANYEITYIDTKSKQ